MNMAQYREQTKNMSRQMRTLKYRYPDTILLFAHDDESYRAYNEDARVCWGTTDATTHAEVFSHAAHDIQALIERLVAAGHRVAICDRVGTVA